MSSFSGKEPICEEETSAHLTVALLRMASRAWADEDRDRKSADMFSSKVAWTWFEQLYDTVKAERTTPPPASRVYGITAVALYESLVDGTRKNRSLVGQLSDLDSVPRPSRHKDYHWPTVANAVLADTIRGLYPTISQASLDAINGLEQSHASQFAERVSRNVYERSVAHGRAVAAAILDWASRRVLDFRQLRVHAGAGRGRVGAAAAVLQPQGESATRSTTRRGSPPGSASAGPSAKGLTSSDRGTVGAATTTDTSAPVVPEYS